MFVAGLLLIAFSEELSSFLAIAGFVSLALAIVALISAVVKARSKADEHNSFSVDAYTVEKVKLTRDSEGITKAVKELRGNAPNLSLVDAHRIVKSV